jgi:hypothetical protein
MDNNNNILDDFEYTGFHNKRHLFEYTGNPIKRTESKAEKLLFQYFIQDLNILRIYENRLYTSKEFLKNKSFKENILDYPDHNYLQIFNHEKEFHDFLGRCSIRYERMSFDINKKPFTVVYDIILTSTIKQDYSLYVQPVKYNENITSFKNNVYWSNNNMNFIEHEHNPKTDLYSSFINANYNKEYEPNHKKNLWDTQNHTDSYGLHLLNTSYNNPKLFKTIIGYALLGVKDYDKGLMLVGIEGGGKSILTQILKKILNENFVANPFFVLNDVTTLKKMMKRRISVFYEVGGETKQQQFNPEMLLSLTSRTDDLNLRGTYEKEDEIQEITDKSFLILNGNSTFNTFNNVLKNRFWIIEVQNNYRDDPEKNIPDLVNKIIDNQEELDIFVNECIHTYINNPNILQEINKEEQIQRFDEINNLNPSKKWILENVEFVGGEPEYQKLWKEFITENYEFLNGNEKIIYDIQKYKNVITTIDDFKNDYIKFLKSINKSYSEREIKEYFRTNFNKDLKKIYPDSYNIKPYRYKIDGITQSIRLWFVLKKNIKEISDNNDEKEYEILKFDRWKNKQNDLENFDNDYEIFKYYIKTNNIEITDTIDEIMEDLRC